MKCIKLLFLLVFVLFLSQFKLIAQQLSATLTWSYPTNFTATNAPTGFGVLRSTSANSLSLLSTVPNSPINQSTYSYSDTNIQYNTTYYYAIYAYNSTGNSPTSAVANVTIPPLPAPTNLVINVQYP